MLVGPFTNPSSRILLNESLFKVCYPNEGNTLIGFDIGISLDVKNTFSKYRSDFAQTMVRQIVDGPLCDDRGP